MLFVYSAELIVKPRDKPCADVGVDRRLQEAGNKTAESHRNIASKLFNIDQMRQPAEKLKSEVRPERDKDYANDIQARPLLR